MNAAIRKNFTGPLLILGLFIGAAFREGFFPPIGARRIAELSTVSAGAAAGTLATQARGSCARDSGADIHPDWRADISGRSREILAEIPQQPHRTGGGTEDARKLTKRDIVGKISSETGLVQIQVFDVVQRILDHITNALADG